MKYLILDEFNINYELTIIQIINLIKNNSNKGFYKFINSEKILLTHTRVNLIGYDFPAFHWHT
jgi:hypothetical protein